MECISGLEAVPLDYGLQDVLARQGLQFEPWVGAAAASFATKLPIPSSCSIFSSEGYFRLKRHHRSICFAPKTGEPIRSLFCIKGMEPLAPDFDSALDRWAARHMPDSGLNLLETFVLMEDKLRVAIGRSTGVFIILQPRLMITFTDGPSAGSASTLARTSLYTSRASSRPVSAMGDQPAAAGQALGAGVGAAAGRCAECAGQDRRYGQSGA
jgi:hypothetical protein